MAVKHSGGYIFELFRQAQRKEAADRSLQHFDSGPGAASSTTGKGIDVHDVGERFPCPSETSSTL
jgi:hypothetical protein